MICYGRLFDVETPYMVYIANIFATFSANLYLAILCDFTLIRENFCALHGRNLIIDAQAPSSLSFYAFPQNSRRIAKSRIINGHELKDTADHDGKKLFRLTLTPCRGDGKQLWEIDKRNIFQSTPRVGGRHAQEPAAR